MIFFELYLKCYDQCDKNNKIVFLKNQVNSTSFDKNCGRMIYNMLRRHNKPLLKGNEKNLLTKTGYELLRSGRIKSFQIGRNYRIPKIYILEYMES